MSGWTAKAPGKFNHCLFVGRPRPGGMHPLVSVMQPLSLADELTLEPAPDGATRDLVICEGVTGPNLAEEALALYRAAGWDGPLQRLTIHKRVPVAAGMGGGSADAAGALRLAAAAAGTPGDCRADEAAPRLGSDVPAALLASRCLVSGIGEQVRRLPLPGPFAVLVLPSQSTLSTPAVYREFDALGLGRSESELTELARALAAASERGDPLPAEFVHNDLQPAALSLRPELEQTLAAAEASGADHVLVSGSGPTVVGLFLGEDGFSRAQRAAAGLRKHYADAIATVTVAPGFAEPKPC